MKDKYYTPKVEEFRVGFEYEIKDWWTCGLDNNGFTERTLSSGMLFEQRYKSPDEIKRLQAIEDAKPDGGVVGNVGCDYRHEWERITTGIKDGTVRVKYLDKKDIESLGFELDQCTKDGCDFIKGGMMDNNEWRLTFGGKNNPDNFLSIYDVNYNSDYSFNGIIKNKSELKELLTKINI